MCSWKARSTISGWTRSTVKIHPRDLEVGVNFSYYTPRAQLGKDVPHYLAKRG